MKILLVGNGAREHAIAKALKKSRHEVELFVYGAAKNPGIFTLAKEYYIGDLTDMEGIAEFGATNEVDFAVVGPDNPIADGAADALKEREIKSFAPSASLARLESSKGFTRNLLKKYDIIGNPEFQDFQGGLEENKEKIKNFLAKLGDDFVVKYDSLLGGKGVKVSGEHLHSQEEGLAYALECLEECGRVVIEEKLVGEEFSLIAIVDGKTVLETFPIQDHKRAYDGDTGPNTGGMGTYSDIGGILPFMTEQDAEDAHKITVDTMKALEQECGEKYHGVMYGGFIITKKGVRLIEYNARFGDPEAMNIFSTLKTDFVDICLATINEDLASIGEMKFENTATVCKYVVPEGYPDKPLKGEKIEMGEIPEGVEVFYGSVNEINGELIMGSSRAISFVGKGETLEEAAKITDIAVKQVKGKVFFRKDIGTPELIQKRIDTMKKIRG